MEAGQTRRIVIAISMSILLNGCASTAPDFHGSWKPINRYAANTKQIPLAHTYVFFVAPTDGTLKTMLTRWSKDTGIKISYQLGTDYTLTQAVTQINTSSLQLAAAELNKVYASQGIAVVVNDWQITVQALPTSNKVEAKAASSHQHPSS